jgi:ribosomal protein S18 acetylase RimI-like enzyme
MARVAAAGARWLVVETSGLPGYEGARALYEGLGFQQTSQIPDFYRRGDARLTYARRLGD